ncbi:HK97 gp10 family phage protein [Bacillus sp. ISL-7]|uniref:HK97 gp10 family phage protein n=1 Tax=Bacillus sp. ISL-7 TaxID=2819136 RepID=UPI001BE641CC|nr:HK97 gp10 family phage protein [Bacillus sp. ISL-7]MBT2736163.1 HK97 gp10 family phage protein [Bacillus sp. ISL-7]
MSNINDLTNEIMRELQRYTNLVEEEVEISKNEVADQLVEELKQSSPEGITAKYSKGWRVKEVGNKMIVHNKTRYQLTHLLEKGHAKTGGGRVPAKVHIAPAEEKAVNEFLDRVEQAIKQ